MHALKPGCVPRHLTGAASHTIVVSKPIKPDCLAACRARLQVPHKLEHTHEHNAVHIRRSCVQRSLCHQGYCARCGAPGVMLGDGETSWGALCGKCATVHCRLIPPQKTHPRIIHKAHKKIQATACSHDTRTTQIRSENGAETEQIRARETERQTDHLALREMPTAGTRCQQPAPSTQGCLNMC